MDRDAVRAALTLAMANLNEAAAMFTSAGLPEWAADTDEKLANVRELRNQFDLAFPQA